MPDVNGVHYDFADLGMEMDGLEESLNFSAFDWEVGRDVDPTYDNTGTPDGGEVRKNFKGTVKIKTTAAETFAIHSAHEGGILGGEVYGVTLTYAKEGGDTHTFACDKVRITKVSSGEKQEDESMPDVEGVMLAIPLIDDKPVLVMPGSAAGDGAGGGRQPRSPGGAGRFL